MSQPERIEGRPLLGVALLVGLLALGLLGHFMLIPAVEAYVPVAACDRWLGTNGLSALLMVVCAAGGLGIVLFGLLASRYWARVARFGQLPPPGSLVFRSVRPVSLESVPVRARLARYLPHVGGIMLALCVGVGYNLHTRFVKPNLPGLMALCEGQSAQPVTGNN